MEASKKFMRTAIAYVCSQEEELAIKDFSLKYSFRLLNTFESIEDIISFIKSNPWKTKFLFVLSLTKLRMSASKLAVFKILLRKNGIKLISVTEFLIHKAEKHRKRCF